MFSKFLAISLAFQIILSVPGLKLFAHYCNGNLSSLSVLDEEDPCHTSKADIDCCANEKKNFEKTNCCTIIDRSQDQQPCTIQDASCCETKVVSNKAYKLTSLRFVSSMQENLVGYITFYLSKNHISLHSYQTQSWVFAPPNISVSEPDICIWVCQFLI